MVVEQVELNPIPGNEDELLAYVAANRGVLEHSKGCRHFMFGRGIEDPTKVSFVVTWDSLEAHKAATQTAEFAQFSAALRGFVTGAKAGHFEVVERR